MNVLSLFDGISCGRVALDKAGINVGKYYASEIDKYAQQVSDKNWPDIIRMGDVTKWREWDIDWRSIDLVLAGSPCQGFSFAGKQLAFNDPRSALFFEFVNIYKHIKELNPKVKFLLENVRMKQEYQDIITGLLGVEPVKINSSLVSAQNRVRLYWANWEFEQPEDKGIILKDVLQDDVIIDIKYYLSNEQVEKIDFSNLNKDFKTNVKVLGHRKGYRTNTQCYDPTGKSGCLDTCGGGGREPHILKLNKKGNLKANQEKASCLTGGAHSGGNHSDMDLIVKEATKKGYTEINPGNCVDLTFINSKTRRGRNMELKSNCLTATKYDYCRYTKDFSIRRLTPIECERLQTLPDDYTAGVSNTQRYKSLGNGWTVDVIAHILKEALKVIDLPLSK